MNVLFIYIGVVGGFSGQAAATELIIDGLGSEAVSRFRMPHLNRVGTAPKWLRALAFGGRLFRAYAGLLCTRLPRDGAIHLSLGLTRFALVRDGLALFCAGCLNSSSIRSVVALNGNVFTEWPINSLNAKLFRAIIRSADCVTCVGTSHRDALIQLGVPEQKVEVVPNVCEYDGVPTDVVELKQASGDAPVELLFLSSLTDTKGYPEYLEALELIAAAHPDSRIHAVLCGPITAGSYRQRFDTVDEARQWIDGKLEAINRSKNIRAEYIPGASGAAKQELFERAQVFVLPTRYPVEAQPLVVIEAMAHGCAIITTDIGELPSTVDETCAIVLHQPTTQSVQQAIVTLVSDEALRSRLGQQALERFKSDFNREAYLTRWKQLLVGVDC